MVSFSDSRQWFVRAAMVVASLQDLVGRKLHSEKSEEKPKINALYSKDFAVKNRKVSCSCCSTWVWLDNMWSYEAKSSMFAFERCRIQWREDVKVGECSRKAAFKSEVIVQNSYNCTAVSKLFLHQGCFVLFPSLCMSRAFYVLLIFIF